MGLGVEGASEEAALFLPVPSRATVKLGHSEIFDELEELTRPRTTYSLLPASSCGGVGGEGGGGGPAPVEVLERQSLGPFDVSTLAASDADALGDWLEENGYELPKGLAEVVEPYVEQGWYYVAARLRPGAASDKLGGKLDPLHVTFASDKIVYPMRVTSLAELPSTGAPVGSIFERVPMPLTLYVLVDHRVEEPPGFEGWVDRAIGSAVGGDPATKFADWVEPRSLEEGSALTQLIPRRYFLTKFGLEIYNPHNIKDDFVFAFTGSDEIYHETESKFVGLWACLISFLFVFGVAPAIVLTRRLLRSRRAVSRSG